MTINEFTAKKIGEVVAFTRVALDTIEKGRPALAERLGEETVLDMVEKNKLHNDELLRVATDGGMIDTTLLKAGKTEEKLLNMRELYVGDQWDNAVELMEWSGFFEGAAIVHWALLRGCAEGLNDEGFLTLTQEGVNYHYELLERGESELGSVGQERSTV